jgi:hypothetical protein
LLTAFPYFAAIAMTVGSGVSNTVKLFLLVPYCVVYTLPLIAIAAIWSELGHQTLRPCSTSTFACEVELRWLRCRARTDM